MKEVEVIKREAEGMDNLPVVDGELIEVSSAAETNSAGTLPAKSNDETANSEQITKSKRQKTNDKGRNSNQKHLLQYLVLPFIFLTVALLGGLRFGAGNNAFIFLKPELVCLIFAAILLLLFFRAGLINLPGWFSEGFSTLKNLANAVVLSTLFAASTQIFNSLLPEKGLPFWIIGFFFFWTLWNNLFSVFDARRLLQSLGSLFGLAFVVKYLVLANLTLQGETWTQRVFETLVKEASFGLLDLPKFSAATGYVQFFALALYVVGLFLLKPETTDGGSETLRKKD